MPGAKRHFSMIREFHLADFFTLFNACGGMSAIFFAMAYLQGQGVRNLLMASAMIPFSLVFDFLDGRIARWRQKHSTMGRELDSLADIISFGVAPASIAYAAGMQGFWDWLVLLYFVSCGVSRLARYNITAEALSEGGDKVKYFEGTPIPTSILLVLLVAIATWNGRIGDDLYFGSTHIGPWIFHPLVLAYAISGSLMISKTVKIPKF